VDGSHELKVLLRVVRITDYVGNGEMTAWEVKEPVSGKLWVYSSRI
jgi:hypothetical protein